MLLATIPTYEEEDGSEPGKKKKKEKDVELDYTDDKVALKNFINSIK